jgi:multimeric flavodoxin WrbA
MMNFVALNASPRKKGNSELLSKLALREASKNGADKTELIHLR